MNTHSEQPVPSHKNALVNETNPLLSSVKSVRYDFEHANKPVCFKRGLELVRTEFNTNTGCYVSTDNSHNHLLLPELGLVTKIVLMNVPPALYKLELNGQICCSDVKCFDISEKIKTSLKLEPIPMMDIMCKVSRQKLPEKIKNINLLNLSMIDLSRILYPKDIELPECVLMEITSYNETEDKEFELTTKELKIYKNEKVLSLNNPTDYISLNIKAKDAGFGLCKILIGGLGEYLEYNIKPGIVVIKFDSNGHPRFQGEQNKHLDEHSSSIKTLNMSCVDRLSYIILGNYEVSDICQSYYMSWHMPTQEHNKLTPKYLNP